MTLYLGVDTGGTYTDAVLMQDETRVVASAKALTTRDDLARGIGAAIGAVLEDAKADAAEIGLVSLSTTLATNALVQGQGDPVCLVFIGFCERDIARQGLDQALAGDPVILLAGGHSHSGAEATPFDAEGLRTTLENMTAPVSAFAVCAQFGSRNPAHELAARDIIQAKTGLPVTCGHELSARLGGPKRAMTALLNGRLIGMISGLIGATQNLLHQMGITAPLMVVRGDGALVSAELAQAHPIETILSGPAASIVGARWLTDEQNAIVSDIGGTTTDVALLRDGRPMIDPDGAEVGGLRTMVEAVAMRTTGLGGDSEVSLSGKAIRLGPKRVMPVSLCAQRWPDLVHRALDQWLANTRVGEFDGFFVVAQQQGAGLDTREAELVARMSGGACALSGLIKNRKDIAVLERLEARGLLLRVGITPSDAVHVLGKLDAWDGMAAGKALTLFARRRTSAGGALAVDGEALAQSIVARLTEQSATALLETAFAEDPVFGDLPAADLARHFLTTRGLAHHRGLVALDAGLNLPVVGLGASAQSYYPALGKMLNCKMILPEHAGVANAIGAVVGQISMRESATVVAVSDGCFRVVLPTGPQDFDTPDKAIAALEAALTEKARKAAEKAGAQGVRLSCEKQIRRAEIEGRDVFVETELTVTASGRPRITPAS